MVACTRSTARTVGRKRYRSDAGVHAAGCLLSARERSTEGARLWPGKCYISYQLLWMMLLLLLLLPVSRAADGGLRYMPAGASCGWLPGSEPPSLPHQPGRGGASLPALLCPHDCQKLGIHARLIHASWQGGDAPGARHRCAAACRQAGRQARKGACKGCPQHCMHRCKQHNASHTSAQTQPRASPPAHPHNQPPFPPTGCLLLVKPLPFAMPLGAQDAAGVQLPPLPRVGDVGQPLAPVAVGVSRGGGGVNLRGRAGQGRSRGRQGQGQGQGRRGRRGRRG